jgi:hypothetical protein
MKKLEEGMFEACVYFAHASALSSARCDTFRPLPAKKDGKCVCHEATRTRSWLWQALQNVMIRLGCNHSCPKVSAAKLLAFRALPSVWDKELKKISDF